MNRDLYLADKQVAGFIHWLEAKPEGLGSFHLARLFRTSIRRTIQPLPVNVP